MQTNMTGDSTTASASATKGQTEQRGIFEKATPTMSRKIYYRDCRKGSCGIVQSWGHVRSDCCSVHALIQAVIASRYVALCPTHGSCRTLLLRCASTDGSVFVYHFCDSTEIHTFSASLREKLLSQWPHGNGLTAR